jgi:hypothetical protein
MFVRIEGILSAAEFTEGKDGSYFV